MADNSPKKSKTSKTAKATKVSKKDKAPKEKRAPSPYNVFMKSELTAVKKANPSLDHKEAFKVAAGNWATSPQNPKNKK